MIAGRSVALPRVLLTASVDTEEDNWIPARQGIQLRNIRALPDMHARMSQLGLRLTYFVAHSVAADPGSAAIIRDVAAAGGEIGAHLHPWNTPPLEEAATPRNTMLKNLPGDLQFRKLQQLTDSIVDAIQVRPRAFRAGRFAVGPPTIGALCRLGYEVDSSVTPWIDWTAFDDGPSFFGAPQRVYRLEASTPVTEPRREGGIIEVPLSTGFNRWPFSRWAPVHRWMTSGMARRFRLAGIAHRTRMLRRILLSPEGSEPMDMLRLARVLFTHGVEHIQIMWHSPTLVPGLTPFGKTATEVESLFRKVGRFVEALHRIADVRFATVCETAALLGPGAATARADRIS